jgi:hypothetical protein
MLSWTPSTYTPQHQPQPAQNNSNNAIPETAAMSYNGFTPSRHSSISINRAQPSEPATLLSNGRKYKNVLTTPSKHHHIVMGQHTNPSARLAAGQFGAMISGAPALDPQNALQAAVGRPPR